MDKRNIALLGSTGSIGTQTLDIIAEYPQHFRAYLLTAGKNVELLAAQARKFLPTKVVIADESLYPRLKELLSDLPIEVAAGTAQIIESAGTEEIDIVVNALVGFSGLKPTLQAVSHRKTIAIANKETLVVAGHLFNAQIEAQQGELAAGKAHRASCFIPVDSEHSAIFQCLEGEKKEHAQKIILTASGGPFRTTPRSEMVNVTVDDALHHPNWQMGAKVTIDSASMMNKGLEMIEAHRLFGCPPRQIEIVVHPQSIVHSMVQFADGSIKAQLGVPDMHLPIRYALGYPERLHTSQPALSLAQYGNLTFEAPDMEKFPLLSYAFDAIEMGGNMPCVLNAANEIAVGAFLHRRIRFIDIPTIVARTMERYPFMANANFDDIFATDSEARLMAQQILNEL